MTTQWMTKEALLSSLDQLIMLIKTTPTLTEPWPDQGQWTYQDWLRLPDDGACYEVIDGVLYMNPPPATRHQFVVGNIAAALHTYAQKFRSGYVLTAPVGVKLPGQPVPLQPDVIFVSTQRKAIIGRQYIEGCPDIVIEILSPGNWLYDRREKFAAYQAAGVPEYWIVDYRLETVEIFTLEAGTYGLVNKWNAGDIVSSPSLEGFEMTVAEILCEF